MSSEINGPVLLKCGMLNAVAPVFVKKKVRLLNAVAPVFVKKSKIGDTHSSRRRVAPAQGCCFG
jgi:hypothetical protein